MKRFVALLLLLVLVVSFGVGLLLSQAQAGSCFTRCNPCTCHIQKCCDGVCVDLAQRCRICPLIICE
jgi:hypothetical protein